MSKKHDKDFLMSRKYAIFVANEYAKRIEKATEWIKNNIYTYEDDSDIIIYDWDSLANPKELLNILGGKNE